MKKLLLAVAALFVFSIGAKAQIEAPVTWAFAAKRTGPTEATLLIKATIDKGWHVYSQTVKEGGPVKTTFTFTPTKDYALIGKTIEPKPITRYEKVFSMNVGFFEDVVIFQQKIKLKSKATTVAGKVEFMTCNDTKCLPPDEVKFSIPVK